jgi:hypothetical protein
LQEAYAKIEPKLAYKKPLSKVNIINLVDAMCQSRRFKVSWTTLIGATAPFIFTCCCMKRGSTRDERIYKKAHLKLTKQLDIIDLLKSVTQAKVLFKSMLSRKQQLLITFQRALVVETTDNEDPSDEDIE